MKTAPEMLMKVMMNGGTVKDSKNMEYALIDDNLCVLQKRNGEEVGVRVECNIKGFISLANEIGRDELWLKCCSIELKKMNTKERT
jgi:hypothetical protein